MKELRKRHHAQARGSELLPVTINDNPVYNNTPSLGFLSTSGKRRKRHNGKVTLNWNVCMMSFMAMAGCAILVVWCLQSRRMNTSTASNVTGSGDQHLETETERIIPKKDKNLNVEKIQNKIQDNENKSHFSIKQPKKIYSKIKCSDNGSFGYLNDDYCDCLNDGRDEPLTSACSFVLIRNTSITCPSLTKIGTDGHPQIISIYASRINDGIIDCLDGSDEATVI